jgi:hypothetical protein
VRPTSISIDGDAVDKCYKFRTQEKLISFVVFSPIVISKHETVILTPGFSWSVGGAVKAGTRL